MSMIQNYLSMPSTKRVLTRKYVDEGFSLIELVVVIAVLAILSAVAIPAFVGVQANGKASAVKNGLVNGVKECAVLDSDDKDTAFDDAQSFANVDGFSGYKLEMYTSSTEKGAKAPDSCFSAKATADKSSGLSDFMITMDPGTGTVTKTCGDDTKPGCKSGKVW